MHPRLHLLPTKLPRLVPHLAHLLLKDGVLYAPSVFHVMMRQFSSVHFLSLRRVTFCSVSDLCRMLSALVQLKYLSISHTSWNALARQSHRLPYSVPSRVRLSMLIIEADRGWTSDGRSVRFLSWLARSGVVSSLSAANLRRTKVYDDAMLGAVDAVLHAAKRTLLVLSLGFGVEIQPSILKSTISSMTSLRVLMLQAPHHLASFQDVVLLITELHCGTLEQFRLWLEQYPSFTDPKSAEWAKFDRALQLPQYASLSRVTVGRIPRMDIGMPSTIHGSSDWYDYRPYWDEQWVAELRLLLRMTHKRGILWYWPAFQQCPIPVPKAREFGIKFLSHNTTTNPPTIVYK
ncbi:uncharacterized protein PHACADRAFT_212110 [Phanerochaete carnosa HHB-10118-sp]|uniref:F-box domain-containing protein n=1 Tax=Phanerochaete carnosa (strain HHB-10118-sp) TaxID=650164 RepID=K5W201_PHACS|nr:uncharacterized protein PHACADRAFT_212110 [Phanerochaete carnosa HHB-10118-sp]EKM52909.1 hypothetical protein PHACADRAFT_212110 [Phanerochaete carnosa HHB-10118-sp]